ncbi:MAG: murein L,D-transpeptidase [Phycisphaerae bacterium]|nr:murein L,D-transpeptidase [Phycisphaerae bacterium]
MSDRLRAWSGKLVILVVWILLLIGARQAFGQRLLIAASADEATGTQQSVTPAEQDSDHESLGDLGEPGGQTYIPLTGRARPGGQKAQATGATGEVPKTVAIPQAVAWQAALDRAGFSPGIIDGIVGPKTRMAFRAFQAHAGLSATGKPDAATEAALGVDSEPAVRQYALTAADAAQVGPHPRDWLGKSRMKRLGYPSLDVLAAERGHCTRRLLAKLNPRVDPQSLKVGDSLVLPNVRTEGTSPVPRAEGGGSTGARTARIASVEVNFGAKVIRLFDKAGGVVGLLHCSIAKHREKRPIGPCRIKTIAMNPSYLFDPACWPEVKGVDRRLTIPPGPRNPVGLCWIGLSLEGYGIHGTPDPELIGKTGSHGCIRLTNWDALRLARMVSVGTEVRFVNDAERVAANK